MSMANRDQAIVDFQEKPGVNILIVSLKAAALGLNLVAANHVVLLDLVILHDPLSPLRRRGALLALHNCLPAFGSVNAVTMLLANLVLLSPEFQSCLLWKSDVQACLFSKQYLYTYVLLIVPTFICSVVVESDHRGAGH